MRYLVPLILIFFIACDNKPKGKNATEIPLKEAVVNNHKFFVDQLTQDQKTSSGKAKAILNWLANNMNWLATDYKQRTVDDIIKRGGGNCHELAMVTQHFFEMANIKKRKIKEINIQEKSEKRRGDAIKRMKDVGSTASVFGYMHNDHVWLEIYDESSNKWVPVDPTMNIFGIQQWIEARLAFSRAETISPYSKDMLLPVSIFALDSSNSEFESRSAYYLINAFNHYYDGELAENELWNHWKESIQNIDGKAKKAFKGAYNFHEVENALDELLLHYHELKTE